MNDCNTLSLLFGGDFAPSGRYQDLVVKHQVDILGDARELIETSDFVLFNLETPLCGQIKEIQKHGPAIRAVPGVLSALTTVGVDALSLANNHIYDFGHQGLEETMSALRDYKLLHVGAGFDRPSAESALRITIKGQRISIFAFAEQEFNTSIDGVEGSAILDPLCVAPLILNEKEHSDAIIVCVHGGNEFFQYPRPGLRKICQFLIELGADAVIGHHPHVPGPYEMYRGKPIVYSLGNLIFDSQNPPAKWEEGYFVNLKLNFQEGKLGKVYVDLHPYSQSIHLGGVRLRRESDRDSFIAEIEQMRLNLEDSPEIWLDAWEKFVESRRLQALIDLSSPIRFRGLKRLMKLWPLRRVVLSLSRRRHRSNLLRCPSHRELTISALNAPDCDEEYSSSPQRT